VTSKVLDRGVCGANRRQGGGPCQLPAGHGTDHLGVGRCKWHGGNTTSQRKAAAVEMARAHVASLGLPVDVEPHEVLILATQVSWAEVVYCDQEMAKLGASQLAGQAVTRHTRPRSLGKDGEDPDEPVTEERELAPALHIWMVARAAAMERAAKFAKMALDAGVDERRVRVQEAQADRLASVVNAVIRDLVAAGLSAELRSLAGERFKHHLASLDVVTGTAIEVRS
jgi:hypothetical protein